MFVLENLINNHENTLPPIVVVNAAKEVKSGIILGSTRWKACLWE